MIEQKANGVEQLDRDANSAHVLLETFVTYDSKYLCSGVLISADYVMTTRSCVFGSLFVNVHVYPYKLRDSFESNREIYRATEITFNSEFDGLTHLNDVALLKLPVTLKISERPYNFAQLPEVAPTAGITGKTIGWGLLNFKDDNAASIKHEQSMVLLAEPFCRMMYPGIWASETTQGRGCVMKPAGTNCVGDSGAPFMVGNVLQGLLSFGQEQACEENDFPNGIQVVFDHLPWIHSVID